MCTFMCVPEKLLCTGKVEHARMKDNTTFICRNDVVDELDHRTDRTSDRAVACKPQRTRKNKLLGHRWLRGEREKRRRCTSEKVSEHGDPSPARREDEREWN